jgi:hypothetical protein
MTFDDEFSRAEENFVVTHGEFWSGAYQDYADYCIGMGMEPLLFTEFCGTSFVFLWGNLILIAEEIEQLTGACNAAG